MSTTLTERQEACLRFLVSKNEPVKPIQFVFPEQERESVLPRTPIGAVFTMIELCSMGLVRRVGKTEIAYESTEKANDLELLNARSDN